MEDLIDVKETLAKRFNSLSGNDRNFVYCMTHQCRRDFTNNYLRRLAIDMAVNDVTIEFNKNKNNLVMSEHKSKPDFTDSEKESIINRLNSVYCVQCNGKPEAIEMFSSEEAMTIMKELRKKHMEEWPIKYDSEKDYDNNYYWSIAKITL